MSLLYGDCREVLPTLPEKSAHCCVTSPPYFGLRDYGHPRQIGLEQTPDEYVAQMVAVFREVRRVLRDDGTLWLNLGDSYTGSGKGGGGSFQSERKGWETSNASSGALPVYGREPVFSGGERAKPIHPAFPLAGKQLIGIPWRVAFALQSDGWYLRQDIIWSKPNPMPESVTDRCTKAHEYIFLLSKSARYFYDQDAIREAPSGRTDPMGIVNTGALREKRRHALDGSVGANRRSVWTVATQPYSGAHFAVFPPALIEPCILAGCPSGGIVLDPFFGSGTTGEVCNRLGRKWIGIELNGDYALMQRERTSQGGLVL